MSATKRMMQAARVWGARDHVWVDTVTHWRGPSADKLESERRVVKTRTEMAPYLHGKPRRPCGQCGKGTTRTRKGTPWCGCTTAKPRVVVRSISLAEMLGLAK